MQPTNATEQISGFLQNCTSSKSFIMNDSVSSDENATPDLALSGTLDQAQKTKTTESEKEQTRVLFAQETEICSTKRGNIDDEATKCLKSAGTQEISQRTKSVNQDSESTTDVSQLVQ